MRQHVLCYLIYEAKCMPVCVSVCLAVCLYVWLSAASCARLHARVDPDETFPEALLTNIGVGCVTILMGPRGLGVNI